jgi:DsbC/DsbD-like thiol-disulfide interchange protein
MVHHNAQPSARRGLLDNLALTVAFAAVAFHARAASISSPVGDAVAQRRPLTTPHGQVALLADSTTLAEGRSGWLGLRFTMDEGWHIYWRNYWRNLGESGSPPEVRWQTPTPSQHSGR